MASRYHWLTPGIDAQFNLSLPTAQAFPASLPAGATLKRFMVRQAAFYAKNQSNSFNDTFGMYVNWTVHFTSGPNSGRTIYSTNRDIPVEFGLNPGSISNVYSAIWHAGDNELGFNERCSYGLASGAAANLQCSYSIVPSRFSTFTNLFGEFSFQFAALYYL